MKKALLFSIIMAFFIISSAAIASGGASVHDETHIPFDKIGWQAVNLGMLLIAIFFFIRKSVAETFLSRQKAYLEQSEKTKIALKNAEVQLLDIKSKLSALEEGEKQALTKAKHEAELLKANIIMDSEVLAEKMKKDVELIVNNEVLKAKRAINKIILDRAMDSTVKNLTEKTQISSTHEVAFIKQLEQVRA